MGSGVVDAVFLGVGAVLILLAVLRAWGLARDSSWRSQVALCLMLAGFGCAFLVQAPVLRGVQNVVFPQLGQLTGNGLTLVAAFFAQAMVIYILDEDAAARVRVRLVALVVALVAMTGLFLANPVGALGFSTPDEGLGGVSLPPIGILGYYAVYLVCVVVALVDLLGLVNRYARRADNRHLRIGLRIVAVGCVVGLVYATGRTLVLVVGRFGVDVPILEAVVGVILPSVGVLLVAGGSTFSRWAPAAGGLLAQPLDWARSHRADRRLAPLWKAVRRIRPDLVLKVSRAQAGLRWYRHLIEIQDLLRIITTRLDPAVRRQAQAAVDAAGLTGPEAAAVVDAAVFAVGIQLLSADTDPSTPRPGHHADPNNASSAAAAGPGPGAGAGDLAATAQHLELVSAAFRRSPVVREFAERIREPGPGAESRAPGVGG